MPAAAHSAWPAAGSYRHLDGAGPADLAWEWLRRDPEYQRLEHDRPASAGGTGLFSRRRRQIVPDAGAVSRCRALALPGTKHRSCGARRSIHRCSKCWRWVRARPVSNLTCGTAASRRSWFAGTAASRFFWVAAARLCGSTLSPARFSMVRSGSSMIWPLPRTRR